MRAAFLSLTVPPLAAAVCIAVGCGKTEDSPKKNVGPAPFVLEKFQAPHDEVGPKTQKPLFSLSSTTYADEFKNDKKLHREKYGEKLIQLTGMIVDVGRANGDADFLQLEGGEIGIQCVTKEKETWKKAWPGQTIKIIGIASDNVFNAGLYDGWVLEVNGPEPQKISASELASESVTNSPGGSKLFDDKHRFLIGEVAGIEKDEFGTIKILFKTAVKSPIVVASFNQFGASMTRGISPGQKIKVLGKLGFISSEVGTYRSVLIDDGR